MAAAQLITRDNFSTLLVRSTQGRAGTPDGNVYFDTANDTIELITAEELANVDLWAGSEANPLTNVDKVQKLALYFFALQEAEADPELQKFRIAIDAVGNRMGKLVGATAWLNGIKLSDGGSLSNDRLKVADSGFTEFAASAGGSTDIDRVLHGVKSLNNIEATSQPFYMIADSLSEADRQAATPVDFSKPWDINEVVQTFGSTAFGDTGAGNEDNLTKVLILWVRTFGFTVGESTSSSIGISELGAISAGYPLWETAVQALSSYSEADVFGGAAIAPFSTMTFSRESTAQSETGFNEGDGDFTDIIANPNGGTLIEVRAYLDMLMQQDTDQNANTGSTGEFRPKRAEELYTIDATGKLITRQGLFIENLPAEDEQSIIFTDNSGTQRTRPFNVGINVSLSNAWNSDTSPWFRIMYADGAGVADFNATGAVTIDDASWVALAGDNTDARIVAVGDDYELRFSFDYDTDTSAWLTAGTDKDMIIQVGGVDNTKRRTVAFTVTRTSSISVDARSEAETN